MRVNSNFHFHQVFSTHPQPRSLPFAFELCLNRFHKNYQRQFQKKKKQNNNTIMMMIMTIFIARRSIMNL